MNADTVAIALDRLKFYAKDALNVVSQCVCKPDATLKLNGRSYRIERLLGEGGFAFVYLVNDLGSGRTFALKKILVTTGEDGVAEAMREIEAYRRFRHPNIIKILDSAVVQDDGGAGKVVYLLLPYYSKGNLQDAISNGAKFTEKRILELFLGTCLAVQAMHHYRPPAASSSSYPPALESQGLMSEGDVIFDGGPSVETDDQTDAVPYAHRDIKPANIMVSDDGAPILMDFGSTIKARIAVETRQQALLEQDIASEQSSMPYRAPELFDVKTGQTLDEKVDIWSLGCTLFAITYGYSPFEVDGSSIAMAVGSGRFRHPNNSFPQIARIIDSILVVDPAQRPDITTVIEQCNEATRL